MMHDGRRDAAQPRRVLAERLAARAAALLACAAVGACSAHPGRTRGDTALHNGGAAGARDGPTSSTAAGAVARLGRTPLAEPEAAPLETSIEPALGGRGVLFVAQSADEHGAFVRRMDRGGELGPVVSLIDEHVLGAIEASEGKWMLVTSDGARFCVATYALHATAPESRGCSELPADGVAPIGDRLAFIEAHVNRPPPPPTPPLAPKVPPHRGKVSHVARPTRHPPTHKASKHAKAVVTKRAPKLKADVVLRFADEGGAFENAAKEIGVRFERPLEGMTLIGAAPRPDGAQLAWYEWDPGRRAQKGALGSARVVTGFLRSDGSFDTQSRATAFEGDLEYGAIRNHEQPRLVSANGSVLLLDDGTRGGPCTAVRLAPSLALLRPAPVTCAVDPLRLAGPSVAAQELAVFERILGYDPKRTRGQPKHDIGLIGWTDERGYFWRADALRSVARNDGGTRDESAPIVARRARIAWGAIARDGEGVAVVDGNIVHVGPDGVIERAPVAAAAAGKTDGGEKRVEHGLTRSEAPVDRVRAARIGRSWWIARGDVTRVWPAGAAAALASRAHPDASALVGGASRGLLIEVAGSSLRATPLDADGAASATIALPSPVRIGFAGVERAAGGALVAGVSAANPTKVIAFALDADGKMVGRPATTTLPIIAGELGVRLVALPNGGALLTDLNRKRTIWLDDTAREIGAAEWPAQTSLAACIDGVPARASVPASEPGAFVRVPELAADGTCVVGEPVWTRNGTLRWFGSRVAGPDANAEIGIVKVDAPNAAASSGARADAAANADAHDAAPASAAEPACPPEMVSIAGRFCVDRFEATLWDEASGEPLSPDFSPTPGLFDLALTDWSTGRWFAGDLHARAWPLPKVPFWQRAHKLRPVAASRMGVVPNGYVTGVVAENACAAAGKRLCTYDEFVTACRGESDTPFPYGDSFIDGACNVYREEHPAALLHGNASIGHMDPRLNRVTFRGQPLLRTTGGTPTCRSIWGSDAVYDLVGNLDEWVDEPGGAFAGGFYARSTRAGCDAVITAHPKGYADYSTGFRCCRDGAR